MNPQRMKKEELIAAARDAELEIPDDAGEITREELIEKLLTRANRRVDSAEDSNADQILAKLDKLINVLSSEKYGKQVGDLSGFVSPESIQNGPKVAVLIYSNEGSFGKFAVTLSLNGKTWNIPRDQRVVIPAPLVEILRNAVVKHFEQAGVNDVDGSIIWREVNVSRFQAQIGEAA